jgi:hypothetical protein
VSTEMQPASDAELAAFLEKLGKFWETLPPNEQTILDQMTIAALNPDEVSGFIVGPTGQLNNLLQNPASLPYYRAERPYYYNVAGGLSPAG